MKAPYSSRLAGSPRRFPKPAPAPEPLPPLPETPTNFLYRLRLRIAIMGMVEGESRTFYKAALQAYGDVTKALIAAALAPDARP